MNLKAIIEGALFVSGDVGVEILELKKILDIPADQIKDLIRELKLKFNDNAESGLMIVDFGKKYKFVTKAEHKEYYSKLLNYKLKNPLTNAHIETLAIVAYKQPCTKKMIEDIRGVSSIGQIDSLLKKELIIEIGRSPTVGNPILYEVTSKFFDIFGIKSKKDLPTIEEIKSINASENFFDSARFQENNE